MTVLLDLTLKQVPPSSCNTRFTIPTPLWTTRRFPALSNCRDLGVVSPVAISAIWYPEATVGWMELVGVREVEHADAEDVAPCTIETKQPNRAANAKMDSEDIMYTTDTSPNTPSTYI